MGKVESQKRNLKVGRAKETGAKETFSPEPGILHGTPEKTQNRMRKVEIDDKNMYTSSNVHTRRFISFVSLVNANFRT